MTEVSGRTDLLDLHFARVYPAYVEAVSKLLITLRQQVGGDLDLVLIMSVIGDRHFANRVDADTPTYETLGRTETARSLSINAHSISQYTKIPRETVRRKVMKLLDMGWISCDEQGNLSPTALAADALRTGTDAAVDFLQLLARTAPSTERDL